MTDPITAYAESPIGWLAVVARDKAIIRTDWVEAPGAAAEPSPVLVAAVAQLREYFDGARQVFELRLEPHGTAFQRGMWAQLGNIPAGETRTYAQVAAAIGRPRAVRAVGHANGRNPISILIPCHRVVGSDGRLTGYGGGLWRKQWLLDHEQRMNRHSS
ncbi:MAG: methylated-DNA--[protein]-cysteine S-methyltransferase [Anaerolineales bacterium]